MVRNKFGYNRSYLAFIIVLLMSMPLSFHRWMGDKEHRSCSIASPFVVGKRLPIIVVNPLYGVKDYIYVRGSSWYPNASNPLVIWDYSILSYFPMIVGDYINSLAARKFVEPVCEEEVKGFFSATPTKKINGRKLILILVESLESWTIECIDNNEICPNFSSLINSNNTVYFPHVVSQVRGGTSGDGQMIVMSGILPLKSGAACVLFGDNTYPSIAKCFTSSAIVNPCPHIWNQDVMSENYGFQSVVEPPEGEWDDESVFVEAYDQLVENDFVLAITISSHLPWEKGKEGHLVFSRQIVPDVQNYLNALHYTDSCFGMFWNRVKADCLLADATVVIVGDHTIFGDNSKKTTNPSGTYGAVQNKKGFIPLIIHSPKIGESRTICDTIYQMDVFPTMLQIIDCDYSWKGLGVNVLCDTIRKSRPIKEHDAFALSNKIITGNWFKGKIE